MENFWVNFNAATATIHTLCVGEVKRLTPEQKNRLNVLLKEMAEANKEVAAIFDSVRYQR